MPRSRDGMFQEDKHRQVSELLKRVFSDEKDERIEFFIDHLPVDTIRKLVYLRHSAFQGTPFQNQKKALNVDIFARENSRPPSNRNDIDLMLETVLPAENILLNSKSSDYSNNSLLSLHGVKYYGLKTLSLTATAIFGIYALFYGTAGQATQASNAAFQAHKNAGDCQLVEKGCSERSRAGRGGPATTRYYDCYKPTREGVECTTRDYHALLLILTMLALICSFLVLSSQRNKKNISLMKSDFDNCIYDAMLTELCKKEGIESTDDIDWSQNIQVNSHSCTLRTLMLSLLASFNKEMYEQIFSTLLPKIINNDGDIQISILNIQIDSPNQELQFNT